MRNSSLPFFKSIRLENQIASLSRNASVCDECACDESRSSALCSPSSLSAWPISNSAISTWPSSRWRSPSSQGSTTQLGIGNREGGWGGGGEALGASFTTEIVVPKICFCLAGWEQSCITTNNPPLSLSATSGSWQSGTYDLLEFR